MAKKVRIGLFLDDEWQEIVGFMQSEHNGYHVIKLQEPLSDKTIRPDEGTNFPENASKDYVAVKASGTGYRLADNNWDTIGVYLCPVFENGQIGSAVGRTIIFSANYNPRNYMS